MRENRSDFWAILAALAAIGIGTLVSSVHASESTARQTLQKFLR